MYKIRFKYFCSSCGITWYSMEDAPHARICIECQTDKHTEYREITEHDDIPASINPLTNGSE